MDPLIVQLMKDVASLQAQVEWLTTLTRYVIVATIGTFITNVLSSTINYAIIRRNNKAVKED